MCSFRQQGSKRRGEGWTYERDHSSAVPKSTDESLHNKGKYRASSASPREKNTRREASPDLEPLEEQCGGREVVETADGIDGADGDNEVPGLFKGRVSQRVEDEWQNQAHLGHKCTSYDSDRCAQQSKRLEVPPLTRKAKQQPARASSTSWTATAPHVLTEKIAHTCSTSAPSAPPTISPFLTRAREAKKKNRTCNVAAKAIKLSPGLPGGNSTVVKYECRTPTLNGSPQTSTSITVAAARKDQAALPLSTGGRASAVERGRVLEVREGKVESSRSDQLNVLMKFFLLYL